MRKGDETFIVTVVVPDTQAVVRISHYHGEGIKNYIRIGSADPIMGGNVYGTIKEAANAASAVLNNLGLVSGDSIISNVDISGLIEKGMSRGILKVKLCEDPLSELREAREK